MKTELLHILQHSLGCNQYGETKYRGTDEGDGCWWYHRNRFVTDPKSADGLLCQELVAAGFMTDLGPQKIADGMNCYTVTEKGRDAMIAFSPKEPTVSRGRRRYHAFLRAKDAFNDLTFREWLIHPFFAESRARA